MKKVLVVAAISLPIVIFLVIGNDGTGMLLGSRMKVHGVSVGDTNYAIAATSESSTFGTMIHELHHAQYITKFYVVDEPLAAAEEYYHDYCRGDLHSRTIRAVLERTKKNLASKRLDADKIISLLDGELVLYDGSGEHLDSYRASARIAAKVHALFGCDEVKAGRFFLSLGYGCCARLAYNAVENLAIDGMIRASHRVSALDFFHSLSQYDSPTYPEFIDDLFGMFKKRNDRGALVAPVFDYREYIVGYLEGRHRGYVSELGISAELYWESTPGKTKTIVLMLDETLGSSQSTERVIAVERYAEIFDERRKIKEPEREMFWMFPGIQRVVIDTSTVDDDLVGLIVTSLREMERRSLWFENNKRSIEQTSMRWTMTDSSAMVIRVIEEVPWEIRVEIVKNYQGVVKSSRVVLNKDVNYPPLIDRALWLASGIIVAPGKFQDRALEYVPESYLRHLDGGLR